MEDDRIQKTGEEFMRGTAGQQRISLNFIKNYTIPIPSLKEQKEIIKQIEKERTLIESQKEVLKLFENKIKEKINSLYGK